MKICYSTYVTVLSYLLLHRMSINCSMHESLRLQYSGRKTLPVMLNRCYMYMYIQPTISGM